MENNRDNRPQGELIVYQGQGLDGPVQVRLDGETVWFSQKLMAELFQKDVRTINEHIQNIYDDEELLPESTIRKLRIVQTEVTRKLLSSPIINMINLQKNVVMRPRRKRIKITLKILKRPLKY